MFELELHCRRRGSKGERFPTRSTGTCTALERVIPLLHADDVARSHYGISEIEGLRRSRVYSLVAPDGQMRHSSIAPGCLWVVGVPMRTSTCPTEDQAKRSPIFYGVLEQGGTLLDAASAWRHQIEDPLMRFS